MLKCWTRKGKIKVAGVHLQKEREKRGLPQNVSGHKGSWEIVQVQYGDGVCVCSNTVSLSLFPNYTLDHVGRKSNTVTHPLSMMFTHTHRRQIKKGTPKQQNSCAVFRVSDLQQQSDHINIIIKIRQPDLGDKQEGRRKNRFYWPFFHSAICREKKATLFDYRNDFQVLRWKQLLKDEKEA